MRTRCLATVLSLVGAAPAQQEIVTTWPDGSVKERYLVGADGTKAGRYESFFANGQAHVTATYHRDALQGRLEERAEDGRKVRVATYARGLLHGYQETFHDNGSRRVASSWMNGELHGRYVELSPDALRELTASYAHGQLDGLRTVVERGKTLTRQKWRKGELVELDGLLPFPRREAELRSTLTAILLPAPAPAAEPGDPLAPRRALALRRLQAYRALCGVPWEGMALVPEWNELCDAAAEVCARNGALSHDPPRPQGLDEARYQQGHRGASSSNLHSGGGMVASVDGYLDDSDPENIARIGHRRWCLNPAMRRTGFGEFQGWSAMWAFDQSGKGIKAEAVYYPPPGYVPIDLFDARRAFSIAMLKGGVPRPAEVRIEVWALDGLYLKTPAPLALDWCEVIEPGYGTGPCLVFRPVGLLVEPGRRYLTTVSVDGGKTIAYRYLVEFCAAIGGR